jgi:deoxyxylulose-5-phosphate synthase
MAILPMITGPRDLDGLDLDQLRELADDVRSFLVENVSRTGGHLGPNLGVVELTIALHRVFDSPADPIIFDTGHQSYVHKLLTGRQDFSGLRSRGGLRASTTSLSHRTPRARSAGPTASRARSRARVAATGTSSQWSATGLSPAA